MIGQILIGVDGGATKSIIRIEDADGTLLGQTVSGPANIRISVAEAWNSIDAGIQQILSPLGISLSASSYTFYAGMGLAGCEIQEAYQAFITSPHAFHTLLVQSDAHIACLGAHRGLDGAIIIAGTGVVGLQVEQGEMTKISGWGFPHDDQGGGAWLGLEALKLCLQWLDGRGPVSDLALSIYAAFAKDQERLVAWANQANSTSFAELAPLVIEQAQLGDPAAITLLQKAASAIDSVHAALAKKQKSPTYPLACALIGGIIPFIEPYLSQTVRKHLVPCQLTPDQGAICLVRHRLRNSVWKK